MVAKYTHYAIALRLDFLVAIPHLFLRKEKSIV